MEEHIEIGHIVRPGAVEEPGGGFGVLQAPATAGNAGHDVGVVDHASRLDAGNFVIGLVQGVVFAHKPQHVLQTALDSQIQAVDTLPGTIASIDATAEGVASGLEQISAALKGLLGMDFGIGELATQARDAWAAVAAVDPNDEAAVSAAVGVGPY